MKTPMTQTEVTERIERLGEAAVLLDAGDPPGTGQVHAGLEEFQAWAEAEDTWPRLHQLAGDAASLVSDIVLEKTPEPYPNPRIAAPAAALFFGSQEAKNDGSADNQPNFNPTSTQLSPVSNPLPNPH